MPDPAISPAALTTPSADGTPAPPTDTPAAAPAAAPITVEALAAAQERARKEGSAKVLADLATKHGFAKVADFIKALPDADAVAAAQKDALAAADAEALRAQVETLTAAQKAAEDATARYLATFEAELQDSLKALTADQREAVTAVLDGVEDPIKRRQIVAMVAGQTPAALPRDAPAGQESRAGAATPGAQAEGQRLYAAAMSPKATQTDRLAFERWSKEHPLLSAHPTLGPH